MYRLLFLLLSAAGTLPALAQSPVTAIIGGTLVDVVTGKPQTDAVILLQGDKILATGKKGKLKIPADAKMIDAAGKWIMPGMIDGHIHFFQSGGLYTRPDALNLSSFSSYEKDQQWIKDNRADLMRRYLACGITTIVDVGGPMSNFDVRTWCDSTVLSPNAFVTGPLISTYQPPNLDKKDPPIIKVNNEEEARGLVRKQIPFKPDFIKIWYIVLPGQGAEKTLPIIKATIDEAHAANLKVAVHATEYKTAALAVEAGCDILVHSIDDAPADPAFTRLLLRKQVTYIPTLVVARKYRETFTQQHRLNAHHFTYANPFMLGTLFDLQHLEGKALTMDYKKMRSRMTVFNGEDSTMLRNLKMVMDAGINVATGTDAGNIGSAHAASYLDELLAMQSAGLSTMQVLQAGTLNAAKGFGKGDMLGSIDKGKLADLLILRKNPLEDLNNLETIEHVIHRGVIIRADTLLPVSPALLVQQQLNAYNMRDMEAFLAPYSDSVVLYDFPNTLSIKGKDAMRKGYAGMFANIKNLHCQLINRIVEGNTVIDQESVTGFGPVPFKAVAIYTIANGKIAEVRFVQ